MAGEVDKRDLLFRQHLVDTVCKASQDRQRNRASQFRTQILITLPAIRGRDGDDLHEVVMALQEIAHHAVDDAVVKGVVRGLMNKEDLPLPGLLVESADADTESAARIDNPLFGQALNGPARHDFADAQLVGHLNDRGQQIVALEILRGNCMAQPICNLCDQICSRLAGQDKRQPTFHYFIPYSACSHALKLCTDFLRKARTLRFQTIIVVDVINKNRLGLKAIHIEPSRALTLFQRSEILLT